MSPVTLKSEVSETQPRRKLATERPRLSAAIYTSNCVDPTATSCPQWNSLELRSHSLNIPEQNNGIQGEIKTDWHVSTNNLQTKVTTTYIHVYQVDLVQPVASLVFFLCLFQIKIFGKKWHRFFICRISFSSPNNADCTAQYSTIQHL